MDRGQMQAWLAAMEEVNRITWAETIERLRRSTPAQNAEEWAGLREVGVQLGRSRGIYDEWQREAAERSRAFGELCMRVSQRKPV